MPYTTASGNWISLDQAKTALKIATWDDEKDDFINLLIPQVSMFLENWIERRILQATYSEYRWGDGTINLTLNNYPVLTVGNVYQDMNGFFGQAIDSNGNPISFQNSPSTTQLVRGQDFDLKIDTSDGSGASLCGILQKMVSVWPKRYYRRGGMISPYLGDPQGNVFIQTYTAGYSQIPADLQLAAELVIANLNRMFPTMLTSESYEERAVSYWLPRSILDMAEIILARYKRIAIR